MARDERARDRTQEASLLDRRSYLRLAGAAAASVATVTGLGASNGAAQDTDYLLYDSFESTAYRDHFTSSWRLGDDDNDTPTTAEARSGEGCVHFPLREGDHYGMAATLDLADGGVTDEPPRELYASYWVKFGEGFDFGGDTFANKLPGFENHERRPSGSAGTPSDGTNGWAARGMFTDGGDGIELGYYCYHMDMSGSYGDMLTATTIPTGEWHHVEQRLALNSAPGGEAARDGTLTMWLDGERVYHDDGMAFTNAPERGVNYAFQVRYGGSTPSPADNDIYIDDWVLSTERVGHPGPSQGNGTSGGGGDGSGDGSDGDQGTVFRLAAADGTDAVEYTFTVEGSVRKRESPSDEAAEGNDEITDNGDGTVTVTGVSGSGHSDSYYVDGDVTNIQHDADSWTLYWDGDEVTAAELIGRDGSSDGPVDVDRFEIAKSQRLGENRMFSVQWAVSASDAELDTVEVVTAQTADDLNFAVTDVAGQNASGWDLFQFPAGTELDVSLRVTDADENVTRETKTVTL